MSTKPIGHLIVSKVGGASGVACVYLPRGRATSQSLLSACDGGEESEG